MRRQRSIFSHNTVWHVSLVRNGPRECMPCSPSKTTWACQAFDGGLSRRSQGTLASQKQAIRDILYVWELRHLRCGSGDCLVLVAARVPRFPGVGLDRCRRSRRPTSWNIVKISIGRPAKRSYQDGVRHMARFGTCEEASSRLRWKSRPTRPQKGWLVELG